LEPRCIALGELIQQTVAMMRPMADEKKSDWKLPWTKRLPLVHADPDRFSKCFINLVDNGNQSSLRPMALLWCRPAWWMLTRSSVYISVTDTGTRHKS